MYFKGIKWLRGSSKHKKDFYYFTIDATKLCLAELYIMVNI